MSIQKTTVATDRKHLSRRNSPATSKEAAQRVDVSRLEQLVLDAVKRAGKTGITGKELVSKFREIPYSSLTARPSALKRKGLIEATDVRRDGAFVLVAVPQ